MSRRKVIHRVTKSFLSRHGCIFVVCLLGCGDTASDQVSTDDEPSSADAEWTMPTREVCTVDYGSIQTGAWVRADALTEISGMVASPSRADLLWMHNDAGDDARLYAVGMDGSDRGRITLPVEAVDWEDISAAACPDGSGPCLWVGDIGDNERRRESVSIYAVPEPQSDGRSVARTVWHFPIRYPNGARDAEALAVAPDGQTFWIFEKDGDGRVRTYEYPGALVEGRLTTLRKSKKFDAPGTEAGRGQMITGADLHPSGTRLLLRVYSGIYEYRFTSEQDPMDVHEMVPRLVVAGPVSEPRGESVTYDASGMDILSITEDPEKDPGQSLHRYPCGATR